MMKWVYRFLVLIFTGLLLLASCSKDSDGGDGIADPDDIVDPRFFGSMEAKINGKLKVWEAAAAIGYAECGWDGCVAPSCLRSFQSGGVGGPDSVTISINFYIEDPEEYGCDMEAGYVIENLTLPESRIIYSTRDICEEEDPSTPRYFCNDWTFSISQARTNIYRGTFSFIATRNCAQDSIVITEGKFEIKSEVPPCN